MDNIPSDIMNSIPVVKFEYRMKVPFLPISFFYVVEDRRPDLSIYECEKINYNSKFKHQFKFVFFNRTISAVIRSQGGSVFNNDKEVEIYDFGENVK